MRYRSPKDADEDGIPLILPETADRHGPSPQLKGVRNLSAEGKHIAGHFVALHRDGIVWSDMAVLYRFRFIGEEVASQLRAAGIPFSWLKKGDSKRTENAGNSVQLVTFHSSKGLEFPVAAIPGLGFLPGDRNDENDEVRLAYVAMTRAMERLIMTYHRRSSFVNRLLDSGVKTIG